MLIVTIQVDELNTHSSKCTSLVCADSEFFDDLLKDLLIDIRNSAFDSISKFRELTK